MSMHVALIRPGATLYDEQKRLHGNLDLPLSPRGREEAAALAAELGGLGLSAIYYGPGESLHDTAVAIGDAAGLRPRMIDELRNLDQGLWQGLQVEEIRRRNVKLYRQWIEDPMTICPPQGETIQHALARIKAAIRPLWKRHRGELIGLVVADPFAQLVASYLRGQERPQLDESVQTGSYERITAAETVFRSGNRPRGAARP